jgi:adenosylmethionine-8-amino-7-oxononanoate aminotransferase
MREEAEHTREQLEAWDDAFLWHPFTPHSVYRDEEPLLVASGDGNYLIDVDGNRYLDGVSSIWCNVLGHRRPEIDHAVRKQLGRIAHATLLGNSNVPAILLAKRLVEITPPALTRVFFSDNGSTAVEVALKMAYQYWTQTAGKPRRRFLAIGGAYHGDTVGAVSVGGIDLFHDRFRGLLFEVIRSPSPYCYRCPLGLARASCGIACLDAFAHLLAENREEVAAVILEPGMQGAGGMIPYPEDFLRRVGELSREHGVLLVFDEVAMGMGRSGSMFVSERESVEPDLLCIAKGLTGGYLPLSATLTTERVFEAFLGAPEEGRTFFHGHTYTGNPLGAAAALATLDVYEDDRVIEGLAPKALRLSERLEDLAGLPAVGEVRRYGLAAGVELVADRSTREPWPPSERIGMRVCRAAREKGVFLRPLGDVIVLMPPLSVTEEEIDLLVEAVEHGIRSVCGGEGA